MHDPTTASTVRLARAAGIARWYRHHTGVAAILVGGSVARGWADHWSDVELGIFWTMLPPDAVLHALAHRAGGVRRQVFHDPPQEEGVDEAWDADGLKIDLFHRTTASVDRLIGDVIGGTDPTWLKQARVATIRSGIALHGEPLVNAWRHRSAYPENLARSMVIQHLVFGPHAWLEMLAERDDTLYLHVLYTDIARRILGTLLGLNRMYPPAPDTKWLLRLAEELPLAPRELAQRLRGIFRAESQAGVQELGRLIDETIALVEAHMPEIQTASIRARVAQRRPTWPS